MFSERGTTFDSIFFSHSFHLLRTLLRLYYYLLFLPPGMNLGSLWEAALNHGVRKSCSYVSGAGGGLQSFYLSILSWGSVAFKEGVVMISISGLSIS